MYWVYMEMHGYIWHDEMILYDIQDNDLKKAQVAVAVEDHHGGNADDGIDEEKEKHHVDVELIHGFKPARMFIPVVPSIYSEGH